MNYELRIMNYELLSFSPIKRNNGCFVVLRIYKREKRCKQQEKNYTLSGAI